jgi:hypothetical protein
VTTAVTHRERWASLAAGALLAVTPFIVFAKHNGYGLLRPELLVCAAVLAGVGVLAGAIMAWGGPLTRVLGMALLATLVVDVNAEWPDKNPLALAVTFAVFALVGWVLRERVATIACVVGSVLLGSTLVLPSGQAALGTLTLAPAAAPAAAGAPPPLVHLVLDEHVGVEGIPRDFDPSGVFADRLERFYTERGFRVFGRAYSRYYDTDFALPNLLNFKRSESFRRGVHAGLGESAYFREMTQQGYAIHVVQSDHLDYCRSGKKIAVASCFTYPLETIDVLEDASLANSEKVRVIYGVYSRLSVVLTALLPGAAQAWQAFDAKPPWVVARLSAIASMRVLDQLVAELPRIRPGSLVFVHLMLPHFPYAYDAGCRLAPLADDWLWANLGGPLYQNTPASRERRYPMYLAQLECLYSRLDALFDAMDATGALEQARIVVHGDHGSRIGVHSPSIHFESALSPADYVDTYSTLFATKGPDEAGGYERAQRALDELFPAWLRGEPIAEPHEEPWVFLRSPPPRLYRRHMVAFEHGLVAAASEKELPQAPEPGSSAPERPAAISDAAERPPSRSR